VSRAGDAVMRAAAATAAYLTRRFPLHIQGVAVAVTFLCLWLMYARSAGGPSLSWYAALGALTFVLLFLQLRLIDDLDDLEHDGDFGVTRKGLLAALGVALSLALLLNAWWWESLLLVLAATAVMTLTPFVVRPRIPDRLATLAICYEAGPALVLWYSYVQWRQQSRIGLPAWRVLAIVGLMWAGYEFWKFSRKFDAEDYLPYRLRRAGRRVVLLWLLLFAALCTVGTYLAGAASVVMLGYGLLLCGGFALAVYRHREARAPRWAGLGFAALLEIGIITDAVISVG